MKLITFRGLYDELSTNIKRQHGQYEKNPANMEKKVNIRFSQSDARIRLALYEIRISYPFRSPF